MLSKKSLRYTMFALLYFTQGTILGYFTALNALYLLDHGLTMEDVGIFATIALLPFVLKIFLGMLSDQVNLFGIGHRKPYILIGLAVQTACLIVVPMVNPATHYWWFVAVAFLLQLGMALYDTCTDGYALDTTPEEEQGTIQSFMVGGRAVATVVTAAVAGVLVERAGWAALFWVLAGLTLLPVPLVLAIREEKRTTATRFNWGAFRALGQGHILALAGLGFVFFLVIAGANQNVNPFLDDTFGIGLETAGFYTAVWGIGVVLGSALSGVLQNALGKKRAVQITLLISLLSVLGLAAIPNPLLAWVLVPLFGVAYGTCQAVFFSLAMGVVDNRIAASMYSILMAITNIAQGVGMAVAGISAARLSFRLAFVIVAVVNVLALPLLPAVFRKERTAA